MHTVELQEEIYKLLQEPFMGEQTFDTTIRMLIEAEYLRRLKRYHYLDQTLRDKYGMDFTQFHQQKIAQKQGYTWEVEKRCDGLGNRHRSYSNPGTQIKATPLTRTWILSLTCCRKHKMPLSGYDLFKPSKISNALMQRSRYAYISVQMFLFMCFMGNFQTLCTSRSLNMVGASLA
ncbi:MAG TPA: hypothetical protein PKZ84_08915 [Anaerolineae bacterium]|nr:hypothetical protein [Anaerolineae bacterium]HQI84589.1 hypothetical protein [Anaerolineae bacterium]